MSDKTSNLTVLLQRWAEGDRAVENEFFDVVVPDLRKIARALLRREPGRSLQSMDLVNEVYLRIAKNPKQEWRDRGHFYALMARMMRRYLIDRARARPKAKFEPIDVVEHWLSAERNDLTLILTIDQQLTELEKEDPELVTVVELKFFLGLTDGEAAKILGIAERTVQRRWLDAKVRLAKGLSVSHAAKRGR